MSIPSAERLHALDTVRGFALLLGVVFHATVSFLPGPQMWIVMDQQRSTTLAVVFFVVHIFRLTLFFLIAGFFGRMLLERRGLRGFVGDRLKRIAAPLAIFWPIVLPAIVGVVVWAVIKTQGALPKESPSGPSFTPTDFPLTHLWFLWVLLLLYAAVLLLRGLVRLFDRKGRMMSGLDRLVTPLPGSLHGPVILAAPAAIAFLLTPGWIPWGGVPTPDAALIPGIIAAACYGTAFGFGWLLQRQDGLILTFQRRWPWHLAAATGLALAALILASGETGPAWLDKDQARTAFALIYPLAIWTSCFGLMGAALRFLSGHSRWRRYLADASYWIYIIHLPIVMALQVALSDAPMTWPAKFALIVGGTLLASLVTYELLVRHTALGGLLNGRRVPWRAKSGRQVREGIV